MQTLVHIEAWDPLGGAPVSLFACSHDDAAVCHADSGTWWPVVEKLPTLRYDLFDGAFGAEISTPASTLILQTEPWPDFGRYSLADARIRLWTGDMSTAPGVWTIRFDGRVTAQPEIEAGSATIPIAVDDRWLDRPLLATYAGTGGAEGPAAMKGQAKPLALGAPRYAPGKLIDSVNSVFQLSAYGAVNSIDAALERLVRFGAPIADHASYAALVAATIPAGTWATATAVGMARFGAPTNGQVSFLFNGDQAGPDGWARKPGQLIRRLALLAGGAGKIDDISLNALDVARPYTVSTYVDEQTTARELIQQIASSVNAVAGVSWLGKLFVAPVGIGAPAVTLAADGSSLPAVSSVKQIEIAAPWQKLAMGGERTWSVHSLSDIAFTATLLDMGAYAAGTTYREGNIVQDQQSSWLYINPTPSSGNAPPTLPTTSNTWWKVLAGKGAPGAAGTPAITAFLTNESVTLPADSSGAITSYAGATGNFRVFSGATDVTASFTFSVQANPQAVTAATLINSATGAYSVTGGFDAAEAGAAITYRATGSGAYAGVIVDKTFTLAKSAAGTAAVSPPLIVVTSTHQTFTYNSAGAVQAQTTTITASRQNAPATTDWRLMAANGTVLYSSITAAALATAFGNGSSSPNSDTLILTSAAFAAAVASNTTTGFIFQTSANGVSDRISIVKVQDGATGAAGADGGWRDTKYLRADAQPTTPAGDNPAGWYDDPPAGTAALWQIVGDKTYNGTLVGVWATPRQISGFTPRGAYFAAATYYLNNTVTFNGGSYVATQNAFSGQAPTGTAQATAYWDVLAAPGAPGTPAVPPSAFSATINLPPGPAVNLRTLADSAGYTGLSNATINFVVQNGMTVRGLSGGGLGIDTGSWPTGSYTITLTLTVQNGGIVDGGGGAGASGVGAGGAGGDAVYCRAPISITINSGGIVRGGGGGGGGGARYNSGGPVDSRETVGGGGGGGGAPNGAAGTATSGTMGNGSNGSVGTISGGGGGGSGGSGGGSTGGAGGAGGGYGAPGTAGGNASGGIAATGGAGGAAGYAVRKNGNAVPVTSNGTMTGTAA